MIIDSLNEFCDATALSTAATGIANVGNIIDLGAAHRDIGNGEDVYLVIQVDTAVTSAGAATVEFDLVSDSTTTIAVDGSATVHWRSAAIPKATLVAGYTMVVELPNEAPTYERYLAVQQNVGTAALTAGKINAFLVKDKYGWQAYADAVN